MTAPGHATYEDKADLYVLADNDVVASTVRTLLPAGGRVLDVGCGSGGLLAVLAGHAAFRAGVERSHVAAERAAKVADRVVNAAVPADLPFPPGSFDVVVCADILEHLPDPAAALTWAASWCRPSGAVVISVPNVGNWQARLRLLRGRWNYEPCGLFDSTHLRFLTRATLFELVEQCGLAVESCVPARLPPVGMQVPAVDRLPELPRKVVAKSWSIVGNALARRRPTLFGYQLVATARMRGSASSMRVRGDTLSAPNAPTVPPSTSG